MELIVVLAIIWLCSGGLKKIGIFDKPYQSYEDMIADCNKDLKKNAPEMYNLKIKQAREWDREDAERKNKNNSTSE